METKIFNEENQQEAAKILQAGGLVAFPTETVYGLGANALLEEAVQQVYAVKGRPSDNPLIVHIAHPEQLKAFVDNLHPDAEKLMKTYWPGPLTLIFSIKTGKLAPSVTGGLSTAAFRMPNHKKTLSLIELAGVPLVGPSANTSGKPSPTTAAHVFHDLQGKIAGILDGGTATIGVESTVLDLSDAALPPTILRPGAVTKEMLEETLGKKVQVDRHLLKESEAPKSPGMKYTHYSPDTPVLMVPSEDWSEAVAWAKAQKMKAGVIAGPTIAEMVRHQASAVFTLPNDTVEAATKGLFAGLRALDEPQLALDVIFVGTFPEEGLGTAYMNRLRKAASQQYFEKNKKSDFPL